jgi:hypothetical protein
MIVPDVNLSAAVARLDLVPVSLGLEQLQHLSRLHLKEDAGLG